MTELHETIRELLEGEENFATVEVSPSQMPEIKIPIDIKLEVVRKVWFVSLNQDETIGELTKVIQAEADAKYEQLYQALIF